MPRLEISLLRSPQIKLNGQQITELPGRAQALFYYLAMTKQQYAREHLAELIYSDEDMPLKKKLDNMRNTGGVMSLKRMLGEYLEVHRHSLAFRVESDFWLDVDVFEASLRGPNPTAEQLQTAVDLYQDDFLGNFSLRGGDEFNDWAQVYRERLRRLAMNALYLLTVHYKQERLYAAGLGSVTRLLALEPYFEEAHREMMLLLALTGQVSEACAHYERYWDTLDAEGLEPEAETKALYQQLTRGEVLPDVAVPLPAPPPQRFSPPFLAPAPLRHFVGRQPLQAQLVAELRKAGTTAVHALVGMGGVGKSSLAAEIARTAQEYFPDGVLWANVAASEPMAVLESWAQAYGYDFSRLGDLESMANAFRGVLADKRVLLVLDDVTSVSRVRPLLPNGPACRVLLTTRDQDLAYALDGQVWQLEELSPENGRLLLTHILGEKRIKAEPEAVTAICDLLQNLPLAVEIIGQRLKSRSRRSLADVAQRLRDEKQRLSELEISDRAVRTSFAISYDTLDAKERRMFALMGVFNGRSFTADTLASLAEQGRYEAEDLIFALVALSLAQTDGDTRYKQHPLLADFAREKLAAEDEGMVYGRLAHTYLSFAQQHPHDYDVLRPEWDNLMAAMQAAHNHQLWQTVIDFADALHDAWFARGRYTQARQGYQWAVKAANLSDDSVSLAPFYVHLGETYLFQSDYAQAQVWVANGLQAYQQIDDKAGISQAHYQLGQIFLEQRQYEEAAGHLLECIALREDMNDGIGLAAAFVLQAHLILVGHSKDFKQAEQLLEKALELQENIVENSGLVTTLRLLTRTAIYQSQYDKAATYCHRALTICDKLADQQEKAYTSYTLSVIYHRLSEIEEALRYNQEAMILFERMGNQKMVAASLHALSGLQRFMGEREEALVLSLKSLSLFRNLQDRYNLVHVLQHLCRLYTELHQLEKASQCCLEALSLAKQDNHMEYENIRDYIIEKQLSHEIEIEK